MKRERRCASGREVGGSAVRPENTSAARSDSAHSAEKDRLRSCTVCGTRTLSWIYGWDNRYRCARHAEDGPRPIERVLAEYLVTADEGHAEVVHEPCGEQVLLTLRVHVDTLARIAREHDCKSPTRPVKTSSAE